ncbi:MAG: hypothetical protein WBF43_12705 [Methylocella sp.]
MPNSRATAAEFCKLCAQVSFVYNLYRSLFVSDASRLELYKAIAPFCFGAINDFLVEYVLLQFSKITDPVNTGKHFNLTTNYILQKLDWPEEIRQKLEQINARLISFRKYIEPERSKRIAHIDRDAQLKGQSLGGFPEGTDLQFLEDLQEFVAIANRYFNPGVHVSITVPGNDTFKLIRALEKSVVFDRCSKCVASERNAAVLDYEIRTSGKKLR